METNTRQKGAKVDTLRRVRIDGDKLKRMREDRFLTREELGEKVEPPMHRDQIGRLERNASESTQIKTVRRVAAALGVAPRDLLEE